MIITKELLRKYSLYPVNYDLSEVWNMLDVTEQLFIEPLLGSDLYDEICEQVKTNQLSPENSTLLVEGGLWQFLGACFSNQTLPYAYLHFSQVGLTKGHSDNSESADLKDITYLTNHLRSIMEELKKLTINWLQEHEDSFPLWNPSEQFCGCTKTVSSCCGTSAFTEPQPRPIVYNLPIKSDNLS